MTWDANDATSVRGEFDSRSSTIPADARQRSMVFVGLGVLVISMVAFFRVPLLPSIGDELRMSAAQLGFITTAFAVGRLASDIPAGRLADRKTAAWLLAFAAAVLAAGSALLASAPASVVVIAAAFVLGVSSAVANTAGMTYFSSSVPTHRRGAAMAAFSAALLGGQALGPAVSGLLASLGTWRTAEWVAALIGLVVVASIAIGSRLRPSPRADAPAHHERPRLDVSVPTRERTILYAVPFVMFFTLGSMPQTLVPLIGAMDFGLSAAMIGVALGVGGLCRFAGAVVGGVVSDRVSRKAALVPGLAFQAVGVALLAARGRVWVWVSAIVLMSLASYGISVAATMLADRSGGRRVGRQLGTFRFVGDVGLIAGPLIAASIFQQVGQRAAVLAVATLLVACAVASAFGLPETRWLGKDVR